MTNPAMRASTGLGRFSARGSNGLGSLGVVQPYESNPAYLKAIDTRTLAQALANFQTLKLNSNYVNMTNYLNAIAAGNPMFVTAGQLKPVIGHNLDLFATAFRRVAGLPVFGGAVIHTIALAVTPIGGGTVAGSGNFEKGSTRTVVATPASGYSFVNWTENGAVVSTAPSFSFALNSNRSLIAHFQSNTGATTHAIALSSAPSGAGSVAGAGTFAAGGSQTVSAAPNTGFSFVNWTENGVAVSNSPNYQFTLNTPRTLVANFRAATAGEPGPPQPPLDIVGSIKNMFGGIDTKWLVIGGLVVAYMVFKDDSPRRR